MSALGSLADICSAKRHVRFTLNSDIDCDFRHVSFGQTRLWPKADLYAHTNPPIRDVRHIGGEQKAVYSINP
jgi:hypothetical protein